jgi:hypothetical protein
MDITRILGHDFLYEYNPELFDEDEEMLKLINEWKAKTRDTLYYLDGKTFLTVYDKRGNATVNYLDEKERKVMLSCDDAVRSFNDIVKITGIEKSMLEMVLDVLIRNGFIYREGDAFFSMVCKNRIGKYEQ